MKISLQSGAFSTCLGLAGTGAAWAMPDARGLGFSLIAISILVLIFSVRGESSPPSADRASMAQYYILTFFSVGFVISLLWVFLTREIVPIAVQTADISAQERIRRKFLIDEIRSKYVSSHPDASPLIAVGLEDVPVNFVNRYLQSGNEKWTYVPEVAVKADGDGLFVSCDYAATPVSVGANERIYSLNLWPVVTDKRINGGLGSSYSPGASPNGFGYKNHQGVLKCRIINYSGRVIRNVVIGVNVIVQEIIKDASKQGQEHSGAVLFSAPVRIDVDRIENGEVGSFSFYIPNLSPYYMQFIFFDTATARHMDSEVLFTFKVSTNSAISYAAFPPF